jgi:hypothetical protein
VPKGAERFQTGHEAAGPGKAAPALELDAYLQVPADLRRNPLISGVLRVRVWFGAAVFVTSNLGLRNSGVPGLPCFDWKSQLPRGFLRADKEPRQEYPRFR